MSNNGKELDIMRPRERYPKGACWNAYQHSSDFAKSVSRIKSADNARLWLAKLNEIDANTKAKELVAERYKELANGNQ